MSRESFETSPPPKKESNASYVRVAVETLGEMAAYHNVEVSSGNKKKTTRGHNGTVCKLLLRLELVMIFEKYIYIYFLHGCDYFGLLISQHVSTANQRDAVSINSSLAHLFPSQFAHLQCIT